MGEWVIILQHTFSRMTFMGSYDNARIRYVRDGIKSPKQHGEKEQEEGLDKEEGMDGLNVGRPRVIYTNEHISHFFPCQS